MPKRLVKKGVTVVREGKRVRPEINKNFDFTADEIERIVEVDPAALAKADAGADDGSAVTASDTPATPEKPVKAKKSSAESSQAAAKGGKKKATAAKSDSEAAADEGDGEGGEAGSGDDDL